jgi:hypothetical protein
MFHLKLQFKLKRLPYPLLWLLFPMTLVLVTLQREFSLNVFFYPGALEHPALPLTSHPTTCQSNRQENSVKTMSEPDLPGHQVPVSESSSKDCQMGTRNK